MYDPVTSPPSLQAKPGEGALGPYLRAIRAHRVLFAVVVAAALLGSLIWLAARPGEYEATARLLVTPLPQDDQNFLGFELLRDSGDPTRTVQTAATLVESRRAADRTAARLGGTWGGEKVLKAVEVSPEGESNIVAVTATAESAGESARVANVFATSALADRREQLDSQIEAELERLRLQQESLATPSEDIDRRIVRIERLSGRGDPTLSLSQSAVPPTSSSDVPALVVLALALVAGLALGAGACVLLEITRARVRDEGEALALYPLPVLARVPELSRRKRETPHGPQGWYMPPSIREAFRTVVVQLERAPEQRVIMVMSGSTGDGKTTSAVNLSASLAAAGHRVVLMDFDVRKPDVARVLGLEAEEQPLSALLDPSVELGSLVTRVPHLPSLLVLPTSVAGHGDVALVEALGRRLPYLLAEAQQMSRYVVIDTAPLGEVSDALRLTSEVDEIVIVTRLGHTRRANYEVMRDLLEGSDSRPRGLIVIGATQMVSHRYYSYGMAAQRAISESLSEVPDSGWGIRSR